MGELREILHDNEKKNSTACREKKCGGKGLKLSLLLRRTWGQYMGLRVRAKKLKPEMHSVDRLYKSESRSGRK